MSDELYWYDNLEQAAKNCRLTGDNHTFTADEVEAMWDSIKLWEERLGGWEEHKAKLNAELIA